MIFDGASATLAPASAARTTTLFSLAGVTKMMTSGLVLRLWEEGRLDLEEPIARYVPYLPEADRITLRMLLRHTSGLQDYLNDRDIQRKLAEPDHAWTRDEVLHAVQRVNFAPGSRYQYSNTNFVALGAAIERASGKSVEAAFWQFVAEPVALTRSFFVFDPAVATIWIRMEAAHTRELSPNSLVNR